MRMPPNNERAEVCRTAASASMRGGMRMPPNPADGPPPLLRSGASMRGGMRMPPNRSARRGRPLRDRRFNEGRHAHAAESVVAAKKAKVKAALQ